MIAAVVGPNNKPKGDQVIIILEPANLANLRRGVPLAVNLDQFRPELEDQFNAILIYTPDIDWISEELRKPGAVIGEVLSQGIKREPVFRAGDVSGKLVKATL